MKMMLSRIRAPSRVPRSARVVATRGSSTSRTTALGGAYGLVIGLNSLRYLGSVDSRHYTSARPNTGRPSGVFTRKTARAHTAHDSRFTLRRTGERMARSESGDAARVR